MWRTPLPLSVQISKLCASGRQPDATHATKFRMQPDAGGEVPVQQARHQCADDTPMRNDNQMPVGIMHARPYCRHRARLYFNEVFSAGWTRVNDVRSPPVQLVPWQVVPKLALPAAKIKLQQPVVGLRRSVQRGRETNASLARARDDQGCLIRG